MAPRIPACEPRPPLRCQGLLAPGTAFAINQVGYAIVRVFNSVNVRVRIKTTQACTLDLILLGPDADQDFKQAAANLANLATQYATGGTLAVAIAAATEVKSDMTLMGEGYLLVKVTWNGATPGSINFVDVSQLAYTR